LAFHDARKAKEKIEAEERRMIAEADSQGPAEDDDTSAEVVDDAPAADNAAE
jgi:DNA-directed RNA polymerase subunit beta'